MPFGSREAALNQNPEKVAIFPQFTDVQRRRAFYGPDDKTRFLTLGRHQAADAAGDSAAVIAEGRFRVQEINIKIMLTDRKWNRRSISAREERRPTNNAILEVEC